MRTWPAALLLSLVLGPAALASPLQGKVIHSEARWGYGGTAVVTESLIEGPDGSRVTVHQLGGATGDIGMWQSHAPEVLATGDEVRLDIEQARTASGRSVYKLRSVLERRRPAPETDKLAEQQEFVHTENDNGSPIHWKSGCALLSVASEGSRLVRGDAEFAAIDEVLATWRSETQSCSYFELINEGREDREVGLDGVNLIKFREEFWCRPATKDDPQECYDQNAAGLTTLFFINNTGSSRNGEILDADVEFNGVQFAIAVDGVSDGNQECQADLANTLTHELGHLMGLDHTCWTSGPRLNDSDGNQVPKCSGNLPAALTEATMYNFQACGETKKASPEFDDIAAVCTIYNLSADPGQCEPADIPSAGCCSIAGKQDSAPSAPASLPLLLLAALALHLTRRRA